MGALRTGSGGQPQITAEDRDTTGGQTVSSTSYVNSNHSLTFTTTRADEIVFITFQGSMVTTVGASRAGLFISYDFDSGGDVDAIASANESTGNTPALLNFTIPLKVSAPGSHTFQLRVRKDSAGVNGLLLGTSATGVESNLSVVQFR